MFINAVEFNKTYPNTRIVNNLQIENLEVGNEARLRCNGEYTWVKVESVEKISECTFKYTGKVLNDPIFPGQPFEKDQVVDFTCDNIFDVRKEYDWF